MRNTDCGDPDADEADAPSDPDALLARK